MTILPLRSKPAGRKRPSVGGVRFVPRPMEPQEVVVNRFAAAETFLNSLPEFGLLLAELPAQVDLPASIRGKKIDQADIEVLHHRAGLFHPADGVAHRRRAGIAPGFARQISAAIHTRSAGNADMLHARIQFSVSLLVF